MIKKIQILHEPLSVKIFIAQKTPVKVIQIADKELLVALKNAQVEKGFQILGKENSSIVNVVMENLQGNVLAVIFTSNRKYEQVKTDFNSSDSSFIINLETLRTKRIIPEVPAVSEVTEKVSAVTVTEKKPAEEPVVAVSDADSDTGASQESLTIKKEDIPPLKGNLKTQKSDTGKNKIERPVKVGKATVHVPGERQKTNLNGDISDILVAVTETKCDSKQIANALMLLKKGLEKDAFNVLDQYIFQGNIACPEQAYFLRAYAFYKNLPEDDSAKWIQAERMFQDALVMYPKSLLLPYGYASVGLIQKKLDNLSAAEGYFNIVKQGYLTYSGLPEITYHLADIYDRKNYEDKALIFFKQVFEDPVENSYIADAGIGYGRSLFKKRQYLDALKILNFVVQSSPNKVYSSSELLLNIGNANFEVGQSTEAREALIRVTNLFPDIKGIDVILSKVGDTYGMENNEEKAVKLYELVREKYPDSEGYIASSIGLARYMKKDADKMQIYEMIKKKFPENSYARIAMMRLAEIYQRTGEYDKCIKEIEDLLSTHPRGLRYEAVKLMQKAYEALFQKQLKEDSFTKVLNRYELEHNRIDRMGSRKIALSVGLAYLDAKLYDQAFNHLINAYKQYKRSSRSEQLLLGLGIAMDESGRKEDALKLFDAFPKRFPKSRNRGEALLRAGRIYLDKKQYALSSQRFDTAYGISENHLEKARILFSHSNVYEHKGDLNTVASLREKAAKEAALAPGENYDFLTAVYKELGRSYIGLKLYVKSADAYLKALSFSADAQEKANLGFLLGDAYQKANILQKAKDAYKQVVTSDDSVWARLAQQRLDTLELAEAVQNS
ncbi:MAG: tetratricopeptide repeat protein [Proteobacteria bacterium]|nr:tetratricopeptide repeat protein [Pseudomonadota bacterium]MBU1388969.1 tetratricopeptide repeat protein [Pseudomonadota bacterium]MBU1543521.1 tetratricopeptide repeat protein [Pseudomonadota bacterium]MBU2431306.1 tetratricopeptide repeat protein [Pseudomonadota bacterium]MBU2480820.1 tetratricopeptide repeat protein [Pseudomonadota bacterium]